MNYYISITFGRRFFVYHTLIFLLLNVGLVFFSSFDLYYLLGADFGLGVGAVVCGFICIHRYLDTCRWSRARIYTRELEHMRACYNSPSQDSTR